MAQVRYDEGVVDTLPKESVPDDYNRTQANPSSFGAEIATGEQKLGAGTLDVARLFGHMAAQDAANQWETESNKILYGDPDKPGDVGLYGLKGRDALEAVPRVKKQIDDLRGQLKGGLFTPDQQLLYDQHTFRLNSILLSQIGRHYDQQQYSWGEELNRSQSQNALHGIASNAGDDDAFDTYAKKLLSADLQQAQLKYGQNLSPEIIDATMAQSRSNATIQRVRGLGRQDPVRARQLLDQNKDALLGPAYDQLKRETDGLADASSGHALAQQVLGSAYAGTLPAASGDLWSRVKGAEGGVGRGGEALVSPKGAVGISQILPDTARLMAVRLGEPYDERRLHTDTGYNERLGKAYLDEQLQRYGGNEALAAAAYNAGPERVDAWLGSIGDPRTGAISNADFASKIPIKETRDYVGGILAKGMGGGVPSSAVAAPTGGAGFDMAAGDSIGVGSIRHGGIGGVAVNDVKMPEAALADAAGSRNPQQALDFVKIHPERFQGKRVLWSSGLMNAADPQASLATVGDQLDALKAAGAMPVLAGVDQGKFASYNTALAAIAKEKGVPFAGPLPTRDVHPGPQGYKDYAASATKLLPASAAMPDTAVTAQPPTAPTVLAAAIPGAPTPAPGSPQERSLSAMHEAIFNSNATDTAKERAWHEAATQYQAIEADSARQVRLQTQQQHQAMVKREDQIWADVYSPSPQITAQQVAVDPAFSDNPERRNQMIALINNPPGSALPAAQSYHQALTLLDRIRRPEGDKQKITDLSPIYAAAIQGRLNRSDFDFVKKEFDAVRTPGGEMFNRRKTDFLKAIEPQIDHSNPVMGKIDFSGKEQFYKFNWMLDQKIDEYRKGGKDPSDLLDPSKPEYMGKAETLTGLQKSLQQSLRDRTKSLSITPPVATAPPLVTPAGAAPVAPVPVATAPIPPAVPQRQPGESPADYLRRRGMAPPAIPTPPVQAPVAR